MVMSTDKHSVHYSIGTHCIQLSQQWTARYKYPSNQIPAAAAAAAGDADTATLVRQLGGRCSAVPGLCQEVPGTRPDTLAIGLLIIFSVAATTNARLDDFPQLLD